MSVFKRFALPIFFVLAFILSWLVWSTSVLQAQGRLTFHVPDAFAFISLSIASVVAAGLAGGRAAIADLLRRWVRWRVGLAGYLVALLLTPVLCLIALAVFRVVGGPVEIGVLMLPSALPFYFVSHFFLFLLTEETAWRGFALPRLQNRCTALVASLILGVLWGVWHLPLFLQPGSFQSALPFGGFVLSTVATTILHTWIFNHTRGSVLVAAIFHSMTDGAISTLGVMSGDSRLFSLFVGIQCLAAVIVVAVEGAAHLARHADLTETTFVDG
jgi:membrane protease YdiL (CAAX protease family)